MKAREARAAWRPGEAPLAYPARIARGRDRRYLVRFPDLPEALTDGGDPAEALREAADCLGEALMSRIADREDIPPPSPPRRGERLVAPDPTVALKTAIHRIARARGLTAAALARALGIDHKEARRILDPHHPTKQGRLAETLAALGYDVLVGVRAREAA
jgi:antitoxin HicB